jgi:hypothetical protein
MALLHVRVFIKIKKTRTHDGARSASSLHGSAVCCLRIDTGACAAVGSFVRPSVCFHGAPFFELLPALMSWAMNAHSACGWLTHGLFFFFYLVDVTRLHHQKVRVPIHFFLFLPSFFPGGWWCWKLLNVDIGAHPAGAYGDDDESCPPPVTNVSCWVALFTFYYFSILFLGSTAAHSLNSFSWTWRFHRKRVVSWEGNTHTDRQKKKVNKPR